jgi:hypothetical protein
MNEADPCVAPETSFWLKHELPRMFNTDSIIKMKDGALTLAETAGTVDIPARTATSC